MFLKKLLVRKKTSVKDEEKLYLSCCVSFEAQVEGLQKLYRL